MTTEHTCGVCGHEHYGQPRGCHQCSCTDTQAAETDAEWTYGDSPAGLRMRAARELAAEFGNDVEEWLI